MIIILLGNGGGGGLLWNQLVAVRAETDVCLLPPITSIAFQPRASLMSEPEVTSPSSIKSVNDKCKQTSNILKIISTLELSCKWQLKVTAGARFVLVCTQSTSWQKRIASRSS